VRNGSLFGKLSLSSEITPAPRWSRRRNVRKVIMLNENASATNPTSDGREIRRAAILRALQADAQGVLERMADELTDLPDERAFGQIELTLRDLAHQIAACAHQAGLEAGKKRATRARASSAPPARKTPDSSNTGPSPG
jgi:hypothetical protein